MFTRRVGAARIRVNNPLRSEADAFRMVVTIGAGAAAVIVLTLLAGARFGVVLAAALFGLGIGRLWRPSSAPLPGDVRDAGQGGVRRVLVIGDETIGAPALLDEVGNRCRGARAEVLVVAPAPSTRFRIPAPGAGDSSVGADRRHQETVQALRDGGLEARGEIGDSDPNVAVGDALRAFAADEVIISTQPPGRSRWLDLGVVGRARREVDLPITHVVVDLEAEAARA